MKLTKESKTYEFIFEDYHWKIDLILKFNKSADEEWNIWFKGPMQNPLSNWIFIAGDDNDYGIAYIPFEFNYDKWAGLIDRVYKHFEKTLKDIDKFELLIQECMLKSGLTRDEVIRYTEYYFKCR